MTIEVVRFEVPRERHARLVGGHADARRAIHAVSPPGALWSRMAQLGRCAWIEIVAWATRSVFERAFERSPADPIARAWFDLAEPGWTIQLGEVAESPGVPPREGELELVWRPPGVPEVAGESGAGEDWSLRVQLDARIWVDPSGWADKEPAVLDVVAHGHRNGSPRTEQASPQRAAEAEAVRDVAVIVHAIDSAREDGPD